MLCASEHVFKFPLRFPHGENVAGKTWRKAHPPRATIKSAGRAQLAETGGIASARVVVFES